MSAEIQAQVDSSTRRISHAYPGRLIAAEGLDGSGKSTQLQLLHFWLQAEGYEAFISEWSPSKLIKRALKSGKKQGHMDAMLMSILHAADFAEQHERDILPALQRGAIVLADRYIYTALARDLARGVDPSWGENLYRFATQPDLSIYFQISAEQSLERILNNHPRLKYYQAGMDLGISRDPVASFRAYQWRIIAEYEKIIESNDLLRCDATLPVKLQQQLLRNAVEGILPTE